MELQPFDINDPNADKILMTNIDKIFMALNSHVNTQEICALASRELVQPIMAQMINKAQVDKLTISSIGMVAPSAVSQLKPDQHDMFVLAVKYRIYTILLEEHLTKTNQQLNEARRVPKRPNCKCYGIWTCMSYLVGALSAFLLLANYRNYICD
jgi:hypothetical protein